MSAAEFSRVLDVRQVEGLTLRLTANEIERAALAVRFELVRIDRLEAEVALTRNGQAVEARGNLSADIVQSCAVSAEDFATVIRQPLLLRFVPAGSHEPDDNLELDAKALDDIEYTGCDFDIGEAVAQSLALAIDPFATGPEAEETRRGGLLGKGAGNPFAALKGLMGNT